VDRAIPEALAEDCPMTIAFEPPIPVLRIFLVEKAREFYLDFLGFSVGFEHRLKDDLPLYFEVRRGDLRFHLSEHYGDGSPGVAVVVGMTGIDAFHAEFQAKQYRYARAASSLRHGVQGRWRSPIRLGTGSGSWSVCR
jgi:catechol 2,3-dioxygenase-like lactoylglutathione lyase family enzyme